MYSAHYATRSKSNICNLAKTRRTHPPRLNYGRFRVLNVEKFPRYNVNPLRTGACRLRPLFKLLMLSFCTVFFYGFINSYSYIFYFCMKKVLIEFEFHTNYTRNFVQSNYNELVTFSRNHAEILIEWKSCNGIIKLWFCINYVWNIIS